MRDGEGGDKFHEIKLRVTSVSNELKPKKIQGNKAAVTPTRLSHPGDQQLLGWGDGVEVCYGDAGGGVEDT